MEVRINMYVGNVLESMYITFYIYTFTFIKLAIAPSQEKELIQGAVHLIKHY